MGRKRGSGRSEAGGCTSRAASSGQAEFSKEICDPRVGFVGGAELT